MNHSKLVPGAIARLTELHVVTTGSVPAAMTWEAFLSYRKRNMGCMQFMALQIARQLSENGGSIRVHA